MKTPHSHSETHPLIPVHQQAPVTDHSARMWLDGRMKPASMSNMGNLALMEVCLTAWFVVGTIFLHLCIKILGEFLKMAFIFHT